MSETLSQLATQVNLLYSSCNAVSQSVQQLLEEQITYSQQTTQLFSEVNSLSSQQITNENNISILNQEVAQLIYYQNLSILSQNNTTFKSAVLSNSTDITATSPISLSGSISGNISYVIIGNGSYNKIIYSFNNYQSTEQSFQFPNSLIDPLTSANLSNSDYSVSSNQITINSTTSPLNGVVVVEGLISGNTLASPINAPTSGAYQLLLINDGQYKKYLLYLNNYVNDSSEPDTISFELPFSIEPFVQNQTNGSPVINENGISMPVSTVSLNGYLIVEGW
jgi:hypothetical protein